VQSVLYKASEPHKMDSLVKAIQSLWRIAERGEWTTESEGNLAVELHSFDREQRIGAVLCSRPVSVPYLQTTELSKL
jgi:hypothetical protein